MTSEQALLDVVDVLNELQIPYMIVGAFSANFHGVVAVSGHLIDWDYVYSWCDRHGTRQQMDEIRQSIPPG